MHSPERTQRVDSAFPGEVTDRIIDHLHDDTESLRATALVSRSWLPSSQHHLFSCTRCQLTTPGKGFAEFAAWLSAARYAPGHVASLILEGGLEEPYTENLCRPEICVQDMEEAMGSLASLEGLVVRGVTLTSRAPSGDVFRPSSRRALIHLTLWSVATTDRAFFPALHLLSLFSGIEQLMVVDLECVWDPDPTTVSSLGLTPPIQHAHAVSTLGLLSTCPDRRLNGHRGIRHLVRHAKPRWQLKTLSLLINGEPLEDVLADLLPNCETTLADLSLQADVAAILIDNHLPRVPSLRRCRHLETLQLSYYTVPTSPNREPVLCRYYDRLLAFNAEILQAAPPTLRTVEVIFSDVKVYDPRTSQLLAGLSNWSMLDDALCRLKRAEVVLRIGNNLLAVNTTPFQRVCETWQEDTISNDSDERVPLLKRMLPNTQASGRLRFQMISVG